MKTYIPHPDAFVPSPCLLIAHMENPLGYLGPYPQFHAVALWDAWDWNPWDILVPTLWTPGDPFTWYDVTQTQLDAANELIHNAVLISHMCAYCNSRWGVPHHPHWQDLPSRSHYYGIPACAYDGHSWPPIWTAELWPPQYAF